LVTSAIVGALDLLKDTPLELRKAFAQKTAEDRSTATKARLIDIGDPENFISTLLES
jgi:hypothetical protein